MKKLDILVVRFAPFVLYVLFGIDLLLANLGIDISVSYYIHSQSALYAFFLLLISLSNRKYHCVWNRAMYAFLIIIPLFNFADALFNLIPVVETYLAIVNIAYASTAIITAYLAIRHFVQMTMRKYYARIRQQSNADNERGGTSPQVRN